MFTNCYNTEIERMVLRDLVGAPAACSCESQDVSNLRTISKEKSTFRLDRQVAVLLGEKGSSTLMSRKRPE